MDKYSLYAAQFLGFKEHFLPKGHNACKGCGVALAVRQVYKALEGRGAALEKAAWQIPWQQHTLSDEKTRAGAGNPTPASLTIQKPANKTGVLLICFDNETTDQGADTASLIKRLPGIAAASGYNYAATACPSHPFDLVEKIRAGWEHAGSAYVHVLCPCPVAWGFDPQNTVRIGRMAVETRLFPLYEIVGGYCAITCDDPNPRPLQEYIKAQERFASWSAKKIESLQQDAVAAFTALSERCRAGAA